MFNIVKLLTIMSAFFVFNKVNSQGIIVNEFSNGDSGTKEFMEFLVIGDPCTTVDLRLWIFDDNNGPDNVTCEGFSTQYASSGIASGHVRFSNISRWSDVPVGSIILVYNDNDKNTSITLSDDIDDSNNDLVYVLPISDSGFEKSDDAVPTSTGDCGYNSSSYSTPASWTYIGLRNTGDACQTRKPDGSYFHGFSYGTSSSNITGGPDDLFFSTSGTDKNFYLNCGHHSFVTDYSVGDGDISDGSSDETPGYSNNTLNQKIVDYYRGTNGCGVKELCVTVLNSSLIYFNGKVYNDYNLIKVMTDSYDGLEHSIDGVNWTYLTTIKEGVTEYEHKYGNNVINYYRIFDKIIAINNTKSYNYIYINILGVMVAKDTDGLKIRINTSTGEKKIIK